MPSPAAAELPSKNRKKHLKITFKFGPKTYDRNVASSKMSPSLDNISPYKTCDSNEDSSKISPPNDYISPYKTYDIYEDSSKMSPPKNYISPSKTCDSNEDSSKISPPNDYISPYKTCDSNEDSPKKASTEDQVSPYKTSKALSPKSPKSIIKSSTSRSGRKSSPPLVHEGKICSLRGDKLPSPHKHRFGKGRKHSTVIARRRKSMGMEIRAEEIHRHQLYQAFIEEQKNDQDALDLLDSRLYKLTSVETTFKQQEIQRREQDEQRKRLLRDADEQKARSKIERMFNIKLQMLRRNSNDYRVLKVSSNNNDLMEPYSPLRIIAKFGRCDPEISSLTRKLPSTRPLMPCHHYHNSSALSNYSDGPDPKLTSGTAPQHSTYNQKPCNIDYGVNSTNYFRSMSRAKPITQVLERSYAEVNDTARSTPVLESLNMSNIKLKAMRDMENLGYVMDNNDWTQNFEHRSYMNPRDSSQLLQRISPHRGSKERRECSSPLSTTCQSPQTPLGVSSPGIVTVLHGNYVHYINSVPLQESYSHPASMQGIEGNSHHQQGDVYNEAHNMSNVVDTSNPQSDYAVEGNYVQYSSPGQGINSDYEQARSAHYSNNVGTNKNIGQRHDDSSNYNSSRAIFTDTTATTTLPMSGSSNDIHYMARTNSSSDFTE